MSIPIQKPFNISSFFLHKLYFFGVLFSVFLLGFILLTSVTFPLQNLALHFYILLVTFDGAPTTVQKSALHRLIHSLLVPACQLLILFAVAFPAPHLSELLNITFGYKKFCS
jgi:hypothetical protein